MRKLAIYLFFVFLVSVTLCTRNRVRTLSSGATPAYSGILTGNRYSSVMPRKLLVGRGTSCEWFLCVVACS